MNYQMYVPKLVKIAFINTHEGIASILWSTGMVTKTTDVSVAIKVLSLWIL